LNGAAALSEKGIKPAAKDSPLIKINGPLPLIRRKG